MGGKTAHGAAGRAPVNERLSLRRAAERRKMDQRPSGLQAQWLFGGQIAGDAVRLAVRAGHAQYQISAVVLARCRRQRGLDGFGAVEGERVARVGRCQCQVLAGKGGGIDRLGQARHTGLQALAGDDELAPVDAVVAAAIERQALGRHHHPFVEGVGIGLSLQARRGQPLARRRDDGDIIQLHEHAEGIAADVIRVETDLIALSDQSVLVRLDAGLDLMRDIDPIAAPRREGDDDQHERPEDADTVAAGCGGGFGHGGLRGGHPS